MYTRKGVGLETKIIHNIALRLTEMLNRHVGRTGLELTKTVFGMERFLINASKLIILCTLSALMGMLLQTVIIQLAFGLLRKNAFGLHALNSTVCTLISCGLFVFVPRLLLGVGIGNWIVSVAFIPAILVLYIYAPADTKARPLVGHKLRLKLKRQAVASGLLLFAATLLIPNEPIKLLLTLGAVYQCVSILPLSYKILKRSERNYEMYEHA